MPRSVPPLRNQDGWSRPQIYYLQARPPLAKVTKLKKSGRLLVCKSGHSCTDELLTCFQLRVALFSLYNTELANPSIAPQMNFLQVFRCVKSTSERD